MSQGFDRGRQRPGQGPRRPGRRPDFSQVDEMDDEEFEDRDNREDRSIEGSGRSRDPRRPRPAAGRPPARRRQGWSLFGSNQRAGRARRQEGFDWEAAEDGDGREAYDEGGAGFEDERELGDEWERDQEAPRRRRGAGRRPSRHPRVHLMDLCTPVFAYAAMLPREGGGIHPGYKQFRQEVLAALQKIETDAPQHGIDKEDAAEARYALALFMDEQVDDSEWSGKGEWLGEPLNAVLVHDVEGGVNFFNHLESLGDRQREVKKVYLVCLALGFRGKYADLEPNEQAARIGEIRQKILRSIQSPLDSRDVLFPEAYEPADPLEGQAPPPPKSWLAVSLGTVFVLLVFWFVMFWEAGRIPRPAGEKLRLLIRADSGQEETTARQAETSGDPSPEEQEDVP